MTRSISTQDYIRLRELLIEARESRGLTQQEVAAVLDRPQSFVSKYERGERRLDVIEFLQVAHALDVHPFDILKGLEGVGFSDERDTYLARESILDNWKINEYELTTLVEENPSLRGILLGYVAELRFEKMWLSDDRITSSLKHDDHDRTKKGDRVVTYKGEEFIVEVKSLQTNSIRKEHGRWIGVTQVDASDRRTIELPDGTSVSTTLLKVGEFDLLAVNLFAFEEEWRFVFAKNNDLPRSSYHKYTPEQQQYLLKSLVTVTWPPEAPFADTPYSLLEELYQERQSGKRGTT